MENGIHHRAEHAGDAVHERFQGRHLLCSRKPGTREGYYQGVLQNEAAKNYGHHITWGPNSHFNRNAQTSPGVFGATTGSYNDTVFNWSTYNADGYQFAGGIHALDNADSTEILPRRA